MKLGEISERIGAELRGDPDREIAGAAGLEDAGPDRVAFYSNKRYRRLLDTTQAAAVLVDVAVAAEVGDGGPALLIHPNPYAGYAAVLELFHPERRPAPGVHPRAIVEDGAEVDPSATVMPLAYVSAGARVGPRTVLQQNVFLGEQTQVGADCLLQVGSIVRERCVLGDRVRLQPGAIVGADGFGYAFEMAETGPRHRKVPQVGIVRIGDDVEIGAGACVDRATTGETVIGSGTKIDNLVQVGHNVTIGPMAILCGQTGVAGSTKVGAGVVCAGQVGLSGHLTVGDRAVLGAQTGVIGDVPPGETWSGMPAMPHKLWLRASAALKELPDLLKRVRRLERRLGERED